MYLLLLKILNIHNKIIVIKEPMYKFFFNLLSIYLAYIIYSN